MFNKRRFGNMSMSSDLKDLTIKGKVNYFLELYSNDYSDIKVNFAVFNKQCQCVKIHKGSTIMDLLRFVSWSGFRGAVDQILLKMKYCIESDKDTIYNICLADDFNINILIVKTEREVVGELIIAKAK